MTHQEQRKVQEKVHRLKSDEDYGRKLHQQVLECRQRVSQTNNDDEKFAKIEAETVSNEKHDPFVDMISCYDMYLDFFVEMVRLRKEKICKRKEIYWLEINIRRSVNLYLLIKLDIFQLLSSIFCFVSSFLLFITMVLLNDLCYDLFY